MSLLSSSIVLPCDLSRGKEISAFSTALVLLNLVLNLITAFLDLFLILLQLCFKELNNFLLTSFKLDNQPILYLIALDLVKEVVVNKDK
ncbi:hypothetical protein WICPIJ_008748 [Wickerhamomyces pijperi]|uniref:Uncharacterized protein n=1 Tax=Wickerhamomyces pijperi TaxID=599730 RepID=A0A9P8PV60_WICPI|nr:hypothetical protein WICPIJ_008748 [Wickerhamomyces pijperi]